MGICLSTFVGVRKDGKQTVQCDETVDEEGSIMFRGNYDDFLSVPRSAEYTEVELNSYKGECNSVRSEQASYVLTYGSALNSVYQLLVNSIPVVDESVFEENVEKHEPCILETEYPDCNHIDVILPVDQHYEDIKMDICSELCKDYGLSKSYNFRIREEEISRCISYYSRVDPGVLYFIDEEHYDNRFYDFLCSDGSSYSGSEGSWDLVDKYRVIRTYASDSCGKGCENSLCELLLAEIPILFLSKLYTTTPGSNLIYGFEDVDLGPNIFDRFSVKIRSCDGFDSILDGDDIRHKIWERWRYPEFDIRKSLRGMIMILGKDYVYRNIYRDTPIDDHIELNGFVQFVLSSSRDEINRFINTYQYCYDCIGQGIVCDPHEFYLRSKNLSFICFDWFREIFGYVWVGNGIMFGVSDSDKSVEFRKKLIEKSRSKFLVFIVLSEMLSRNQHIITLSEAVGWFEGGLNYLDILEALRFLTSRRLILYRRMGNNVVGIFKDMDHVRGCLDHNYDNREWDIGNYYSNAFFQYYDCEDRFCEPIILGGDYGFFLYGININSRLWSHNIKDLHRQMVTKFGVGNELISKLLVEWLIDKYLVEDGIYTHSYWDEENRCHENLMNYLNYSSQKKLPTIDYMKGPHGRELRYNVKLVYYTQKSEFAELNNMEVFDNPIESNLTLESKGIRCCLGKKFHNIPEEVHEDDSSNSSKWESDVVRELRWKPLLSGWIIWSDSMEYDPGPPSNWQNTLTDLNLFRAFNRDRNYKSTYSLPNGFDPTHPSFAHPAFAFRGPGLFSIPFLPGSFPFRGPGFGRGDNI